MLNRHLNFAGNAQRLAATSYYVTILIRIGRRRRRRRRRQTRMIIIIIKIIIIIIVIIIADVMFQHTSIHVPTVSYMCR